MRNPPRSRRPAASYAYPGAIRRRVTWGRGITLAPGWRIVDVRGTPRIVDPMGWRTLDLPGDGFDSRGGYTVRPAQIRALSPACRDWFKATARNIAASDKRIKERSTVATIAQLNPTIAARHKRLNRWANGGARGLETPAPWNPSGSTAACPDYGRERWHYEGRYLVGGAALTVRVYDACGCECMGMDPHRCGTAPRFVCVDCGWGHSRLVTYASEGVVRCEDCAESHVRNPIARPYPPRADWFRDRIIARHLPRMARVQIRRAA